VTNRHDTASYPKPSITTEARSPPWDGGRLRPLGALSLRTIPESCQLEYPHVNRRQHLSTNLVDSQVSELLSMEKCDKAVMDFLAATDVGKFPPKMDGGIRAGGLSLISSLFLCILF